MIIAWYDIKEMWRDDIKEMWRDVKMLNIVKW